MSIVDPIGDMITRIRNGQMRSLSKVEVPASKFRTKILEILRDEGYISNFKMNVKEDKKNNIYQNILPQCDVFEENGYKRYS